MNREHIIFAEIAKPAVEAHNVVGGETTAQLGLVSILTPCFNSAETLPRYMAGISSQTCRRFEVVFVNDGSTDDTERVFCRLAQATTGECGVSVKYIVQPNKGPCAAINTAIAHASGEFLLFCDSDDMLLPCAVAEFLEGFREHPEADMIFARYNMCDSEGRVISQGPVIPIPSPNDVYDALLAHGMFIKAGAYCFRRHCLDMLPMGKLNEANYGQNLELLLHVAARGIIVFRDVVTVNLFARPDSRSRRQSVSALRRQTLDSKRIQMEIIRQYGCRASTRRAFAARFLPMESMLYFLEGNWRATVGCLFKSLVLGCLNRRLLQHAIFSAVPVLRRRLAQRWYPQYVAHTE